MLSKLLVALIVIKNSAFFWQEFLKLEDMKTQTVWCQNAVSLYHLGKEIQGPIAVNLFMFLQIRKVYPIRIRFIRLPVRRLYQSNVLFLVI